MLVNTLRKLNNFFKSTLLNFRKKNVIPRCLLNSITQSSFIIEYTKKRSLKEIINYSANFNAG